MKTVLNALNQGLHAAFAADDRVHMIGEDILDPYGGAFRVCQGLSSAFPDRVHTSPISEAGIMGLATGMALRGLRPVVEIMFGDFTTLIADQVINHLVKFPEMYNHQVQVPVVIRAPMGGRRGYGATHSQTLEKLFMGVPGLQIIAPTAFGDPAKLLENVILHSTEPVFFVENKSLYTTRLFTPAENPDLALETITPGEKYPSYGLKIKGGQPAAVTLAAYGYMAHLASQAVIKLAYEHEIFCELVVPTLLTPHDPAALVSSTRQTRRLLVLEEGTRTLGWGAEVIASVVESLPNIPLQANRLAAKEQAIPASGVLEASVLPGIDDIVSSVLRMVT